MDGYTVAQKLREYGILSNVMIVAISGYGQKADIEKAKSYGIDTYLVKPVGGKDLERVLA